MKDLLEKILKAPHTVYWFFVFFVSVAEIILTYWNLNIGFMIYVFILISLLIMSYIKYKESTHTPYIVLTLIPLIRIVSVSVPLSEIPEYFGFIVVSIPLFITAALVAKTVRLTCLELGFSLDRLYTQLFIALLGLPLGFIEFFVSEKVIVNMKNSWNEALLWVVIFIICVGLLEEIIFRGVLLNVALKTLGTKNALYFTSVLYAVLNISGQSFLQIIYAFLVSILFCRLFIWQKSLLGLSLAHGIINIIAYILCPLWF